MNDILNAFKGKRTYLIAVLIAFSVFAHQMGWINKETLDQIYIVLTGAGIAALRAGIK